MLQSFNRKKSEEDKESIIVIYHVSTYPEVTDGVIVSDTWSPTFSQLLALVTIASASIAPNPNWWLTVSPAPLVNASSVRLTNRSEFDVFAIRCCMSLHVRLGLKED